MRIAVIDMGTNTFHLLIVDVVGDNWKVIYREKAAVKLGKGGINEGLIVPEAEKRALTTLHKFKEVIGAEKVQQVFATATSAIRNAKNGVAIVQKIKEQVGFSIRVISGLEEAEHIYYGVTKAMDLGEAPSLIMDIGGGSIEFIIGNASQIFWKRSFEIGGQRLVEKFHKQDPMPPVAIEELHFYLEGQLHELLEAYEQYHPQVLVGSSGTFDTLSDIYCLAEGIERAEGLTEYPIDLNNFHKIVERLKSRSRAERLAIPGMIPLRVDMIVVAVILIEYVVKKLNIQSIRASAYALKEGVLLNTIKNLKKEDSTN